MILVLIYLALFSSRKIMAYPAPQSEIKIGKTTDPFTGISTTGDHLPYSGRRIGHLPEAIYLDTAHLDPVARTSNAEELSLMGTTGCVAGCPAL
jgi:hypothetical protein